MILVANTILGDEKAMWLQERHEQSPKYKGFHRYQAIGVIRDGKLAVWRKDMGPISKFKGVKQLNIPSLMEHTVDELMDLADSLRHEHNIDFMDFLGLDKAKLA